MSGFFSSLKSLASGASGASRYDDDDDDDDDEGEDTRMKFSFTPQPGDSGFGQWVDAMKMVARLRGGIPAEFRKRLWLTLAERHLDQRRVDWRQAEKVCFNEWSNPDDEELGIQIVKDLHRTGCSLFCGAAGRDNQAVLRRVLLGFARWNKSVGYCQGLNVLAALILQVQDRAESSAVKVMIYLIEGVLPEGYFADNLRGLSVDMAVFRDLLRARLPRLSKHLDSLQYDPKDKSGGSVFEPPLTNVFTMQWFLTLFCHCLPHDTVLRVWDLIFLEGDEILLRTALAIWQGITERILTVTSADEFYSIMGVLTKEMLDSTDTNAFIQSIVQMPPLQGVTSLREKHRYNITPWSRRMSDDDDSDSDSEPEEKLAVTSTNTVVSVPKQRKPDRSSISWQGSAPASDRERLALDISTLKQQYAKLRERQRQAHIILSAACARQSMVASSSQAVNHLLVGKSALVSGKPRHKPTLGVLIPKQKPATPHSPRGQIRNNKQSQGVTLHWKDTKKSSKNEKEASSNEDEEPVVTQTKSPSGMPVSSAVVIRPNAQDSDSDSTSTELCDEPDRMSDVDSEEATSTSDLYVMATTDDERNSPAPPPADSRLECTSDAVQEETSIAKITDQIRRLSAEDADFRSSSAPKKVEEEISDIQLVNDSKNKQVVKSDELSETHAFRTSLDLSRQDNISVQEETVVSLKKFDIFGGENKIDDMTLENNKKFDEKPEERDVKPTVDDASDTMKTQHYGLASDIENNVHDSLNSTYSKSYTVGHLPISPITVDRKYRSTPDEIILTKGDSAKYEIVSTFSTSSTVYSVTMSPADSLSGTRKFDRNRIVMTPESSKSYSSGETMGPDSKTSSVNVSPRTPYRPESCDIVTEKSAASSNSSESKTLTLHSVDSERISTAKKIPDVSLTKSPSMSTDSLQIKSFDRTSNSSESYCSPTSNKLKSSERSISSELLSPISANSIKYTSSSHVYKTEDGDIIQSPIDAVSITSPFYPISHPNQKTPSPYETKIQQSRNNTDGHEESTETSPEQRSVSSKGSTYSNVELNEPIKGERDVKETTDMFSDKNEVYESRMKKFGTYGLEKTSRESTDAREFEKGTEPCDCRKSSAFELYHRRKLEEDDTLSPLPKEQFDSRLFPDRNRHSLDSNVEGTVKSGKCFERSATSLDRQFLYSQIPPQETDSSIKPVKRSSDILQDLRHLEAKTVSDGKTDTSLLTRKTGHVWEDLQNLEARRQDTFSDSASGFSRTRIEIPEINISTEARKTYIVEPKINMDENSDSHLKTYAMNNNHKNGTHHDDEDEDRESKLGVWTKVKPRKKNDNGRRSCDRALKIIQENSAILQKILTCQAKKRLPDLEEISNEIMISPINEEISKIFSPILEKMGLNEHEINEELARINYKDLDRTTATTTTSEFDAKIDNELSKLSIIDDNDVEHLTDPDICGDYLDARDQLIDHQINEELSKLLANYENSSGILTSKLSKNISETNVFSYKSANDSIDKKTEHSKDTSYPLVYSENSLTYMQSHKYPMRGLSDSSDSDICREWNKLDQLSCTNVLQPVNTEISGEIVSKISYESKLEQTPKIELSSTGKAFDISPLKSPYESYTSSRELYDYKSRISTRISPSNSYSIRTYEKSSIEPDFEPYTSRKTNVPTSLDFGISSTKRVISKDNLEFRLKYNEDGGKSPLRDVDLESPFQTDIPDLKKGVSYYTHEPTTPNNYRSEDRGLSSNYESSYQRRNYDLKSPSDYSSYKSNDINLELGHQPYKTSILEKDHSTSTHLSPDMFSQRHTIPSISPPYKYTDSSMSYGIKLTPSPDDTKRPVSHPEFPKKLSSAYSIKTPEDLTSSIDYKRSSLSLSNIGSRQTSKGDKGYFKESPSPKTHHFSPFPTSTPRKPKELALKLGLYSPTSPSQSKRS